MGISAKDAIRNELIGREIEVVSSNNKSLMGLKGKIIDETKSSITVLSDGKRKMIMKSHVKMLVKIGERKVLVDGKMLTKRPEDRINLKGD